MAMKIKIYNSYSFRDKDPVIDYLRTAKKRVGCNNGQISRDSGVSSTTLHNWFDGKTRWPQFSTVVAAARGIGPEGVEALAKCIRNGGKQIDKRPK